MAFASVAANNFAKFITTAGQDTDFITASQYFHSPPTEHQILRYFPNDDIVELLKSPVHNERGQTLLYVALRFCKNNRFMIGMFRSLPKEVFGLKNSDDSTAIMGFIWGLLQGTNLTFEKGSEIQTLDYYLTYCDSSALDIPNYRGETARIFRGEYVARATPFTAM